VEADMSASMPTKKPDTEEVLTLAQQTEAIIHWLVIRRGLAQVPERHAAQLIHDAATGHVTIKLWNEP
jgi:hypothetical protein